MKVNNIAFWIATVFIFLFEGIMPGFTGHSEIAKAGVTHLGYPEYFVTMLVVFKVMGATVIFIPGIPARIKEWAYAGIAIELICATLSNWIVDGFTPLVLFPLSILGILALSYLTYHKKLRTTMI